MKLDDGDLQFKYLRLIANGSPRGEAASGCNISSTTVRRYCAHNPDFLEALLDAEEDAFDPIEHTTRQLAKAGDISAIKEYRSMKRRREVAENRRLIVDHQHTVKIDASDKVRELIQVLRERRDGREILEGEIVEELPA